MKVVLAALFLVVLSARLQQAAAACITCDNAQCCPPAYGAPTCTNNKCSFKCSGGRFKCGATCFPFLRNGRQTCVKGNYAYKCLKGASACADLCCRNGPPGSTVVCPVNGRTKKATCSFSCPGGFTKCGRKCYPTPVGAVAVCSAKGKFTFKCTGGLTKCANLCCPNGPAGSTVTCPKNPTSKVPYCSYGCGAGKIYCGGRCKAAAAPCKPWCTGDGKVQCNCPAGYKRNRDWSACLKA